MCKSVFSLVRGLLGALVVGASGAAAFAGDSGWKPPPVPPDFSGPVSVEVRMLDVSGSVARSSATTLRTKSAAAAAVTDAPTRTYLLVGTFHDRSRVLADRFLLTPQDRAETIRAIDDIQFDGTTTDVDALEEFLHEVRGKLTSSYGPRGLRMKVQVLTDGVATDTDRDFAVLCGRKTSIVALGGDLKLVAFAFPDVNPPAPLKAAEATTPATSVAAETSHGMLPIAAAALALVAIALATVAIRRARAKGQEIVARATPSTTGRGRDGAPVPSTLVMSEWSIAGGAPRRLVRAPSEVPYRPGLPVVVGADGRAATFPLENPGAPPRLCSVTLDGRGGAVIAPAVKGLLLDGIPTAQPVRVDLGTEHVVRVATVEVQIAAGGAASNEDDVFFGDAASPSANGSPPVEASRIPETQARHESRAA